VRERFIECFNGMPGLIGTLDEIARLVGAPPQACNRALESLVRGVTVRRRADGRCTHAVDN
jgi:DNA-binding IclR family transcriptional regulator